MKILPVGAELLREKRRTDMTKQVVGFRNFSKVPKNIGRCILAGM